VSDDGQITNFSANGIYQKPIECMVIDERSYATRSAFTGLTKSFAPPLISASVHVWWR